MATLAAWLVHAYTASGVVLAFLAATDIFQYRYRAAFFWLAVQIFVDSTDGWLARRFKVAELTPAFLGSRLDDIVDYVCYVFVPALFVWRSLIVPRAWAEAVCAAMLVSSAYGFSRADSKTDDHFFKGFPSYWNIVVFYLLIGGWPQEVNAGVLVLLSALVFMPVVFVYPSRTREFRTLTISLGVAWGALMLWMLWRMPGIPRVVFWLSMVFPLYYTLLSAKLTLARTTRGI